MAAPVAVIANKIFTFPPGDRLKGTKNWRMWKRKIYDLMRLLHLEGHLTGESIRPFIAPAVSTLSATRNTDLLPGVFVDDNKGLTWDESDYIARVNITWNIVDLDAHGIADDHTASEIWTILLNRYEDQFSRTALMDRLRKKKYEDGTPIMEHIEELNRRRMVANDAGAGITDDAYKGIIIRSLPRSWMEMSIQLFSLATPAEVITQLRLYEMEQRAASTSNVHHICKNPTHGCIVYGHTFQTCYSRGGGMEGQRSVRRKSRMASA